MPSNTYIFYIHGGAYEISNHGVYMPFLRHFSYRTPCTVYEAKYITYGIQQIHENLESTFWESFEEGKIPVFMGGWWPCLDVLSTYAKKTRECKNKPEEHADFSMS